MKIADSVQQLFARDSIRTPNSHFFLPLSRQDMQFTDLSWLHQVSEGFNVSGFRLVDPASDAAAAFLDEWGPGGGRDNPICVSD